MLKKMSEEMKKKLEETLSKITLPLELLELKEKMLPVQNENEIEKEM